MCLLGNTTIGDNTKIYSGSVIIDSVVHSGSIIKSSYLEKTVVGTNCNVGPFANLRAGSVLCSQVKVGAFCEIKNSVIGSLTKISHLCYIGDASISRECNFGCGVVFANFNGKTKQKIKVGKGCFIGCNVNLIAPLIIEDGVYVCAGTTVTKNLEANDFVIGRAREEIKKNRAIKYLKGAK